jgi:hypothetical protein
VASLLLLNVGLFLGAAVAGAVPAWFGWMLTGRSANGSETGDGGSTVTAHPTPPHLPAPSGRFCAAGPDDLARSA